MAAWRQILCSSSKKETIFSGSTRASCRMSRLQPSTHFEQANLSLDAAVSESA